MAEQSVELATLAIYLRVSVFRSSVKRFDDLKRIRLPGCLRAAAAATAAALRYPSQFGHKWSISTCGREGLPKGYLWVIVPKSRIRASE
jgi:hypothetical protein